jgi:hypothetical protein
MNRLRCSVVGLTLLVLALAALSGCASGPAVKVVVLGVDDSETGDRIERELDELTDNGLSISGSTKLLVGDTLTLTVSPVADVQAFAKKIKFGTVNSVDLGTRTIEINYRDRRKEAP